MTTTRKHLRITITGETYDDLIEALKEVHRKVEEEYISGFDSNESGDYEFDVTEEVTEMTTLHLTERQVTILGIALTNLYDEIAKSGEGQQMRDDIMEFSRYIQKQSLEN